MNPWEIPTAKIGAGAVIIHDGKVLLAQINYSERAGRWILPGGKIENGETLVQGVTREVLEETGLDVEVQHMVLVRQRILEGNATDFYFVFRANVKKGTSLELRWPPEEMKEVKFWPIDEVTKSSEVPPTTKFAVMKAVAMEKGLTFQVPNLPEFPKTDFIFAGD